MRLLDLIDRQPARVSFGRRTSGGTLNVLRASDRVTLYSETGETVELLAADSGLAGVMTASDRGALAAAGGVAERHLPTQDAIATATISAATGALRTLGHTTPGDLGGATFRRVASEPAHAGKRRSLDRFLPDGSVSDTDGGWWEMLAEPAGLRPEQFGAIGDGVADDTAAFLGLRAFIIGALGNGTTGPAETVTIEFAANRHYTYTNNKWLYGLPNVRVNANGARLECTSTAVYGIDHTAFTLQSWMVETGFADRVNPEPRHHGHLMADTPRGQPVVTLATAAEATEYAPGDSVLVAGFSNQDNGAPPDYRWFEYRTVASADAQAGTVTLTEPLSWDYRAAWPVTHQDNFTGDDIGPARLIRLNRPARALTRFLEINDAVFLRNRNNPDTSRVGIFGALHFRFNRCDMSDMLETTFGSAVLIECTDCRLGDVEGDKLTDRVVLRNCEAHHFNQFVGTRSLEIWGGRITGIVEAAARDMRFSGVEFDGVRQLSGQAVLRPNYPGDRLVERLVYDGVRVTGQKSLPLFNTPFFVGRSFSAIGPTGELLIPKTSGWDGYNHLHPGARMASADGAILCEVVDLVEYDASNWALEVVWLSAQPALPVTLYAAINRDVSASAGTGSRFNPGIGREAGRTILRFSSDDPAWSFSAPRIFDIHGRPIRATVDVLKPFTGSGSPTLWVRDATRNANLMVIDFRQAGLRTATPAALDGALGFDAHTAANWLYLDRLHVGPRTGGMNSIGGAPGELPVFTLEMEVVNLI